MRFIHNFIDRSVEDETPYLGPEDKNESQWSDKFFHKNHIAEIAKERHEFSQQRKIKKRELVFRALRKIKSKLK
tara:strand:+ start:1333 stop:1554 length:222 start_codon:yes stop_codon:yes gene_type:complete